MVVLHVKRGEDSLFLYSCTLGTPVSEVAPALLLPSQVLPRLVNIHNGRRKVARLAEEVLDLAKHGVAVKPELAGLLAEQVKELKLVDEYEEQCLPSGGFAYEADPVQRRNGRAPTKAMKEVRKEEGGVTQSLGAAEGRGRGEGEGQQGQHQGRGGGQ